MESMLMEQQNQDEYIKQLAYKVDVLITHIKMLERQIAHKQPLHLRLSADFLVSLNLTLGSNAMP